ncbi:MAG: hypothetical protein FWH38_05780 [Treponema sp.]|nr:hypothetical protein [Treponema sp.]
MAFDEKPSIYSDRGAIGSAEELDAYGVWVKSEPQDLASSFAGVAGFDSETLPFEPSFDTGFDGLEDPDMELSGIGGDSPGIGMDDFRLGNFDDELAEESGQIGSDQVSTQLLMKIADELSFIRSELTTLKEEISDIRSETEGQDDAHDFFAPEEDEKASLSGDEMDNILSSSDPRRDADEAALRKLSEQKKEAEEEEIEINFDDLGIDLDEAAEGQAPRQETEEAPGAAPEELSEDISIADALNDIDEMRELRLEGAAPISAAPEDTSYLEDDPFAIPDATLDDFSLNDNGLDLNLDMASLDLNLDDFAIESPVSLEDELDDDNGGFSSLSLDDDSLDEAASFNAPPLDDEAVFDGDSHLDLSGALEDQGSLGGGFTGDLTGSLAEAPLEEPLPEAVPPDTGLSGRAEDEEDDSLAQVIPEAFENAVETSVHFDDDLEALGEDEVPFQAETPPASAEAAPTGQNPGISPDLKNELKNVLSYMDHLLESLPENKIEEFAKSEYFEAYKKLFKDLGLV